MLALGVRDLNEVGPGKVDVFGLIRQLGIRLHLAPAGEDKSDLDGMYVRRDGQAFIFVNTAKWLRRQRMTAAHELGHHFLVGDDVSEIEVGDWDGSTDERVEELEAFDFARELLMDRRWLRDHCCDVPTTQAIARTVEVFEVSPDAAAVRLAELGLISREDKDAFLDGQKDETRRLRFGRTPPRTNELEIDPLFGRRVSELAERGILADTRATELKEHALPAKVEP